jgi:3-dehydroquinate synthase II
MTERKAIWVRADGPDSYDDRKTMVTAALEAGLQDIVLRQGDEALRRLGRFHAIFIDGEDLCDAERMGKLIHLASVADQDRVTSLRGKVDVVVVDARDWKVIPLENIIAQMGGATKTMAVATSADEARLFLATLEKGVDGVVIDADAKDLRHFANLVDDHPRLELAKAKVVLVKALPKGDRVCVDTCSNLRVGEGMLVGSQSSCLFLVQSEALESEYVAARPFRVNAGAVHAYVMTSTGRTKYLSEVKSGDEILAVDSEGECRTVAVGRAKVEVRPLLLIEVEAGGRKHSTVLQNAETIRLCTPSGSVSVAELKSGDEVLVRLLAGGRHFGHAINETITER